MSDYCLRFTPFDGTHTEWLARQPDGTIVGGVVREKLTHYRVWLDGALLGVTLTRRATGLA